jgi:hypothetical protein
MRVVGAPQRGQWPLVLCQYSACMAMPPSESRSSGSFVPFIGISVSRRRPAGSAVPAGSVLTQHGVSPSVPSQKGGSAVSHPAGRPPCGRHGVSLSATTRRFWSCTISQ